MPSPEFSLRLAAAREYRDRIANDVRVARSSGLRAEARDYLALLKQDPTYQEARRVVLENRWQMLGERLPEFSQEVWQEAGEVISGINNGVKAAVFAIVAEHTKVPNTYVFLNDLAERFRETFAGTELLEAFGKNTKHHAIKYCEESLCDVGLLTRKLDDESGKTIGFFVIEKGRKYLPFAHHILTWEASHEQSLLPVLGQTNSSGETRAPENTIRILYYLAKHIGTREVDVAFDLGVECSLVERPLSSLHRLGFIDRKVVNTHTSETEVRYEIDPRVSPDETAYVTTNKLLQDEICEIIQQESAGFSCLRVYAQLPEEIRARWKERALKTTISTIFSGLTRQGMLRRVDDFKGKEKQSHITITPKGREFVSSLILPLLRIANSERPADRQNENFASFAQTSADLYYPHSSSHKTRAYQQNRTRVLEELVQSTIPVSVKYLAGKMGLSKRTISKYLKPQLPGSDTIIVDYGGQPVSIQGTVEKGVVYYQVVPTTERRVTDKD